MRLDRLLNDVDVFDRPNDARKIEVTKLTEVLDEVEPGTLFFCVVGARRDSHDFAVEAVARGAVALVVQREVEVSVPLIRVDSVRAAMAPIASTFYEYPSRRLRMFAVTGTNGKTTTTHILQTILELHRWKTEVIGTLTSSYTTPPAILLQKQLADFREAQVSAVAMEVSSMALDQHRVDSIRYDVGIFTNLTQDHLDYHGTMIKYFDAKAKLFEPGRVETAVINVDDEWGRKLIDRVAVPVEPYSLSNAKDLDITPNGSSFEWRDKRVQLPLFGQFNVYNALGAMVAARSAGVPIDTIVEAVRQVPQVPGRMEIIRKGQPFGVVVDFAHTPDGLQNVLQTARLYARGSGRVLVVFGCGGDRDKEKRPICGEIMERLADEIVVTSDNPRSEDPATIANEMLSGMTNSKRAHVYLDRRIGINQAVAHARPGDVVVIAGKGHERTQEIDGVKHPFLDTEVAGGAVDSWLAARKRAASAEGEPQ
jgi:UDP-N-acetylmuramoyl-L-alanyl-D-glutamate--2,6-diaminopimelate ligase